MPKRMPLADIPEHYRIVAKSSEPYTTVISRQVTLQDPKGQPVEAWVDDLHLKYRPHGRPWKNTHAARLWLLSHLSQIETREPESVAS